MKKMAQILVMVLILMREFLKKEYPKKVLETMKNFIKEEDGIGVVEIILIVVVLIGLVLIFKKQLTNLVNDIFSTITDKAGTV